MQRIHKIYYTGSYDRLSIAGKKTIKVLVTFKDLVESVYIATYMYDNEPGVKQDIDSNPLINHRNMRSYSHNSHYI